MIRCSVVDFASARSLMGKEGDEPAGVTNEKSQCGSSVFSVEMEFRLPPSKDHPDVPLQGETRVRMPFRSRALFLISMVEMTMWGSVGRMDTLGVETEWNVVDESCVVSLEASY